MSSDKTLLQSFLSERKYQSAKAASLVSKARKAEWPVLETEAVTQWLNGENVEPLTGYRNSQTGKFYKPHHLREWGFVNEHNKRYLLAKGGEGGGKSVCGIIRTLERVKVGAHGIFTSPDFEHFRRSLWREFQRWCPWEFVVPKQRYRASFDWEPGRPFQLAFTTGAILYCGGAKENEIMSWEGPNVSFCHFDECRRHRTAVALKVFDGRVRIPVGGYQPQIWLTTTPRKHWLYDYFGGVEEQDFEEKDPRYLFKQDAWVITLLTSDNEENLSRDFASKRAQTLTAAEARVYLEAQWEDVGDADYFLPSMTWWDACKEELPLLGKNEPVVIGVDAAKGRDREYSDCFGLVVVSRHPSYPGEKRVAVRDVMKWQAAPGKAIMFDAPEGPANVIRKLCKDFSVVEVAYDPKELLYLCGEVLNTELVTNFRKFTQQSNRNVSDKELLDLISSRRLAHDGNPDLREHVVNSNRKLYDDGRRFRIVKREESLKIDLVVALSMAANRCIYLNL